MPPQQPKTEPHGQPNEQPRDERTLATAAPDSREMPCPICGTAMPDLKGGKATICPVCGFKDSCCY